MFHKLSDGPCVLTVVAVEPTEGQFGPQIKFTGEDGTDVYVSEKAATQQLGRLNLTMETVVGRTLMMEQVKKDGKTFTNFKLAMPGSAPSQSAPQSASAAPVAPKATLEELVAVYAQCVTNAVMTLGAKCEAAQIPCDAAAIQAAAATLFIAYHKQGR